MEIKEEIKLHTDEVSKIIYKYLPGEIGKQKTLFKAMNYSFLAGGKRLRPMLMLETFRLFGGKGKVIEPFMAAIEMIHTSSLIHDDLPAMDDDEYRRGKKTTHIVFGEANAILAGDGLILYAFETASKALTYTDHPEYVVKAMEILSSKSGIYGMVGGQTVDVELEGRSIDLETLDFIYELKTAALIESAMMIGAVLAGASDEDLAAVEKIGLNLGKAFQIQDDILDVIGDEEQLGKPVGSDEKNQKTTYVTHLGTDKASEVVKELTDEAIETLRGLEKKHGTSTGSASDGIFLERLFFALIKREK